SMQGVDKEKIRQSVDNSYLANRARASEEANPAAILGLTGATWYGISQGMDKLNPKFGGEFQHSLLGKLGRWGDKISTRTWLGRRIEGFARWADKQITNISGKSKIVYSLKNHSTRPEWQFAKVPGAGVLGFLASDTEQVIEEFIKPISYRPKNVMGIHIPAGFKNHIQKLENFGLTQTEIDAFAQSLKGKSFLDKTLALQVKELELLGADAKVIANVQNKRGITGLQKLAEHLKIKKLGFKNMKEFEALKGKFLDNPDKVIKMLDNMAKKHPNWKVSIWRGQGTAFSKIKNHLFGRTVNFSEYRNKYLATTGKGSHTALGKFLQKAVGWITEGGTNRYAGGKLAVLMQAYIFGDMLYHSIKAPKGEKGKTLAERAVNDFTYFIAMSLGIMGLHKIGGFKYAGLDVKGREAYREALKTFNEKVTNGVFKSKKSYNTARKALDKKLGVENIKNPITKLLHKIGKFVNIGNERVLSYRSPKNLNLNFLRKIKNGNIIGVPLRILVPMLMVSPFLAKWTTKAAHKIFGKPTNSVLDEDKEPNETEAKKTVTAENKINPPSPNAAKPTNTSNIQQKPRNPQDFNDTNLIKMALNGEKPVTRTYIPSPECGIPTAPARTYIPNPAGMIQKDPDTTAAEKALAEADMAEKFVNETIASLNQK
ncbi:MAG: hypothetical protein K2F57_02725, partial [Candidatus Gastranaerophilales bacterium]|nr:hypothetical protein [Candidatus Gastranaerophilales bacterium]